MGTYLETLLLSLSIVVAFGAQAPVFSNLLYLLKSFIGHRLVEHVNFVEKFVITQFCFLHKNLS